MAIDSMRHCMLFLATFSCAEGQSLGYNVFRIFPDNLEDSKYMHDLGKPFKMNIRDGFYENPVGVRPVVVGERLKVPFRASQTFQTELRSAQDLFDSLNVQGSLTVGYGQFSVTGAAEYAAKKGNTHDNRHVEFRTIHVRHYVEFVNPRLNDTLGLRWSKDVFDKFGTHYIAKIYFGASCRISLHMKCGSHSTMTDLKDRMAASLDIGFIPGAKVTSDIEKMDEQSREHLEVTVQADSFGVDIPGVPMSVNATKMLQYKEDFDDKYFETSDEDLYAIAYELRPIKPFFPEFNADRAHMLQFSKRLDTVGRRLVDASYLDGLLRKSRLQLETELKHDIKDTEEILNPMLREIRGLIDTVEESITNLTIWRGRKAHDIMTLKEHLPEPISSVVESKVKGFAGLGYLKAEETSKHFGDHTRHAYYQGFLSENKPIYRGELMANCRGKDNTKIHKTVRFGRLEELSKIPTFEPAVWNPKTEGTDFGQEWWSRIGLDDSRHLAPEGSVVVGLRLHFLPPQHLSLRVATAELNNVVGGILKMGSGTWMKPRESCNDQSHCIPHDPNYPYNWIHGYNVELPDKFVAIGARLYYYRNRIAIMLKGAPFDPWCNQVMYDSPDVSWFTNNAWDDKSQYFQTMWFNDAESVTEGVRFVTGARLAKRGTTGTVNLNEQGSVCFAVEVQTSQVNWKEQPAWARSTWV